MPDLQATSKRPSERHTAFRRPFWSLARYRFVSDAFRFRALFAQTAFLIGFVFLIVAVEEHPFRIAFASENVRGDAVEEPAVVRNHHYAAGKFQQCVFQRALGFHVEVVGRFVQQQHIAAAQQGFRQVQTSAFAA